MDNLRWVLLLIGVVVVAAIYLIGRFGREKAPRVASRAYQSLEENETPTESFAAAAAEDEPDFTGWAEPALSEENVEVVHDVVEADLPPESPAAPSSLETPKTQTAAAQPVDIKPLVLVLTVMAPDERPWNGDRLKEALEVEGLRHGDMNIFHFHEAGEKDAVFSAANAVEPGVFDLASMHELETPGITLFCQLPGPLDGIEAFDLMLDKARSLAQRMDGQVCDDRRNALTPQSVAHYHDRIESFSRELALAAKKAGEKLVR